MKSIGELLGGVTKRLGVAEGLRRQAVLERWAEAAGVDLAGLTEMEGCDDGTVTVRSLHPAAAMELRLREAEIVGSLNRLAGEKLFSAIRVVSPPGRRRG